MPINSRIFNQSKGAPWLLGVVVGLISLLFYFLPNAIYRQYITEPTNLFLNFHAMGWIAVTTGFFVISSLLAYSFFKRLPDREQKTINRLTTLKILQYLVATILIIYISYVFSKIGWLRVLDVYFLKGSANGNEYKAQLSALVASSRVGWVPDLATAFMVWSFWQFLAVRRNKGLWVIFVLNILLLSLSALVALSRDVIVTLLITLASVYAFHAGRASAISAKKMLMAATVVVIGFLAIFSVVGIARSSNISSARYEIAKQLMGYFPASYNRLSYVLDGQLQYPNSGWGYYSTQFIWDIPLLSNTFRLYEVGRRIGVPLPVSQQQNWQDQFSAVKTSGLNPSYIWSTIFGFVFADFGYLGVLYFAVYGLFAGFSYYLFSKGRDFGIITYPFVVATIVKWPSIIAFSQRNLEIFFAAWLLILVVDKLPKIRAHVHSL